MVVANLAPRKMRGIESNGMILMAEDKEGKLHFVNPDDETDAGSSSELSCRPNRFQKPVRSFKQ